MDALTLILNNNNIKNNLSKNKTHKKWFIKNIFKHFNN